MSFKASAHLTARSGVTALVSLRVADRSETSRKENRITEEEEESGAKSLMMSRRSTCKETIVLCNVDFSDLAVKIGSEWQHLGIRLGLNPENIFHIKEDNPTAVNRIIAMLELWNQQSSCEGNKIQMVKDLCSALTRCNRADLANYIETLQD
ncbi:uncharacterized protein LOC135154574 [Lytechinus pictus]|uniref:uncharacterized protein LOC135154574 n=1 Tax=Lytechinus pictus TaxID=7653 RepID=UPI0030B9D6EF